MPNPIAIQIFVFSFLIGVACGVFITGLALEVSKKGR